MAKRDEAGVLEIVEEAQTDQWRPTLYGVDFGECARVCGGPGGRPGNQSRNPNPFSIWRFYHRGVNTVGRLGQRWSTPPRPARPRGPTLAGHTQRAQCPQTQ